MLQDLQKVSTFPLKEWRYSKIIAGSPDSRFDFAYIATFNYESWAKKIQRTAFQCISIEAYVTLLAEKHVHFVQNHRFDWSGLEDLLVLLKEVWQKLDGEWFMRLSYRSPKDVPEGRLPIQSPRQMLQTIIESERCYDDLIAHGYHQSRGVDLPPLNIVLVPWDSHKCSLITELRCFVFNKNLVAITRQSFEEEWPFRGKEMEILHLLEQYICELWHRYPDLYDSAIVDILVQDTLHGPSDLSHDASLHLDLIEFNPYGERGSSSAGFFDWTRDRDLLFPPRRNAIVFRWSRWRWNDLVFSIST
jgi:hypothetical protein